MTRNRAGSAVALTLSVALLAACSGGTADNGTDTGSDGEDVTLTWWHNSNAEPGQGYYEQVAADFEAENPGVTIEISALAHEDMLTRLNAAFQTGDTPDVYMERGGGELAAHVEAGLTKDISEGAADTVEKLGGTVAAWQVDGQTYALPFSFGLVGFWYNEALFEQAGISEAPETMDDLYAAVDALEAADIEPIAVGAGDGWPAAHYWYYLALRHCSEDVINNAVAERDFSDPCFVAAGESLQELIEAEPFNTGFLATPAQEGPTSASGLLATGQVAMELAGHWEPGVMQGLTEDGEGLGEDTGWFTFPAVEGGEGDQSAALGGGDAWAVSEGSPDVAVDFVEYLLSDEVQIGFAENDMGLPTNPAANDAVSDPALADLLAIRDEAPYVQLYFDTLFGENIGGAMNDEIVLLFSGSTTPQGIVDAMQAAADQEG
ncbi:ABC transporter substrate-binding protein [Actinotalea sp. C106]|uniref:ABC transporter substrate-binding protein n=1 Tax=Actinotalea sp. C106 TaxID=2908644 RepID=UPI002028988B|nr:extracellular solute-binding protein [Actinotalea sp. C106]